MMSQQQRFIQLPLVGVILLGFLLGVYLVVWRFFAKPDPEIVKHTVDTPAEDALKYWTADKMRKAKPAKMPKTDDLKRRKQEPRRPSV